MKHYLMEHRSEVKRANTVKKLIEILKKYPEDTHICSGEFRNPGMSHYTLEIRESNPIGDRDSEEELLLWIGFSET